VLSETGNFGILVAYFMVIETQKWGLLHTHAVWYMRRVTLDSVKQYLQDPQNKSHLIEWLESMVREYLSSTPSMHLEPTTYYHYPVSILHILMPILSTMQLMLCLVPTFTSIERLVTSISSLSSQKYVEWSMVEIC
jgi:hypothetical protein